MAWKQEDSIQKGSKKISRHKKYEFIKNAGLKIPNKTSLHFENRVK